MNIGICGTGRMGSAIAEHLIDQGFSLHVWNRTRKNAQSLIELGVQFGDSPRSLVSSSDTIISILLNDDALEGLYNGADGLLNADLKGKTIIEMSTVKPDTIRRHGSAVANKGGIFVECPVGGTTVPARSGQLLGLAGGSREHFEQTLPLLNVLCRRVEHVGPLGAGSHMKLAVNLPLIVYWEALGEAMSLARSAGIDAELAGSILADTSGTPKVGPVRIPSVVETINGNISSDVMFTIAGMGKDLGLMVETAADMGYKVPAAEATKATYDAATADGWGQRDGTLAAAWRILANMKQQISKN